MSRKKPVTSKGAERLAKRERAVGLEPDDAAAKWLEQNEPKPELPKSKSAGKSKTLHRWRQAEQRKN